MKARLFLCVLVVTALAPAVRTYADDVPAAAHPATPEATRIDDAKGDDPGNPNYVFVCDVSESMKTKMPMLQLQLGRAIRQLRVKQSFDILLMCHDDPASFAPTLVRAVPGQKKRAQEFIDNMTASGVRGRLTALDVAIRLQPYAVVLFVDRNFPADAARARLREINPDHKVRVKVIILAASTEPGGEWLTQLQNMAKENGGHAVRIHTEPYSLLFGDPGNAGKISYVSVVSLHLCLTLKVELFRAVAMLPSTAKFSMLFATDGRPEAFPNDATLLPATRENHLKAEEFLDQAPFTALDPSGAMTLAFSQRPELICLVSDGDFPDNAAVIAKIAALNKGKRIKINTIALTSDGDTDFTYFEVLKKIAKENGGTFRIVKDEDL